MKTKVDENVRNTARIAQINRLDTLKKRDRLMPCIDSYDEVVKRLRNDGDEDPTKNGLAYITNILRDTYGTVLDQIGIAGKTGISAINAVKRSAGTNFQGLCEYAILLWLIEKNLPISIGPNAPKSMKDELTIHGIDADSGEFSVEPDIDISLWVPDGAPDGPVVFLSAKTSLVDRAGQAARWKLYLDLHQTTCPHTKEIDDCPINRTKINIRTAHPITHCIVTANIYKIDTTQPGGELMSGQCRNNTYMFKHKFTTRNDLVEIRPESWEGFPKFLDVVSTIFSNYFLTKDSKAFVHLEPIET